MCRCEMFATNHEPMACLENKTLNLKRKLSYLYVQNSNLISTNDRT